MVVILTVFRVILISLLLYVVFFAQKSLATSNVTVSSEQETLSAGDAAGIFGAVAGGFALFFSVYTFSHSQRGFMKLHLECKLITSHNGDRYIRCKTSIENTSRKIIPVNYAFLIIVDHSVKSFKIALSMVFDHAVSLSIIDSKNRQMAQNVIEVLRGNREMPNNLFIGGVESLGAIIKNALDKEGFWQTPDFSLILLRDQSNGSIASLERSSSVYHHKITRDGIYSVYFYPEGVGLRPEYSLSTHDQVAAFRSLS